MSGFGYRKTEVVPRVMFHHFLFCVILSVVASEIKGAEQSLVLLNVLWRHGDRNPRKTLGYNDPYQNESYWPSGGFGSLNNEGKRRMFQMGQGLREKYGTFLGNYSDATVRVRSTDKSRTLMTAECVLAGLFPPEGEQIWNQDLLWQPISIHTVPLDEDVLLYDSAECPGYDEDQQNYFKSDEVQQLLKQNITKLERFKNMTGYPVDTIKEIVDIYDTVRIQLQHNYTPPTWIYEFYPDWVYPFYEVWHKNARTYTTRMKRVLCGPIFEEWRTHLLQLQNGTLNEMKAFLYSAHDNNIIDIRSCFGYETPWVPPFGSSLVMEVHYGHLRGFYIKMLYHNGTEGDPVPLSPMGCSPECSLDEFIPYLNPFIPESWHEECFGKPHTGLSHDIGYYLIMAMYILSAAMGGLLVVFLAYKRRPSKKNKYELL